MNLITGSSKQPCQGAFSELQHASSKIQALKSKKTSQSVSDLVGYTSLVVYDKSTTLLVWWLSYRLLHCVSRVRSPHETNICTYGLQVVVPDLVVCVFGFSMFVNTPTIQFILSFRQRF